MLQAQDLVFNENVLLQTLGFDVAIDHPHTHVVRTCHLVKGETSVRMRCELIVKWPDQHVPLHAGDAFPPIYGDDAARSDLRMDKRTAGLILYAVVVLRWFELPFYDRYLFVFYNAVFSNS